VHAVDADQQYLLDRPIDIGSRRSRAKPGADNQRTGRNTREKKFRHCASPLRNRKRKIRIICIGEALVRAMKG
jgi:hypothetical protein